MASEIEAHIEQVIKTLEIIKKSVNFDEKVRLLTTLSAEAENPELWGNQQKAQAVLKERAALQEVVSNIFQAEQKIQDLTDLYQMAQAEQEEDVLNDCEQELMQFKSSLKTLQASTLLSEEADSNNCFLEINSGAGGTEAQDWVAMLARMYSRWAERRGFSTEIVNETPGEEAGFKSIALKISGAQAYG